MIQRRTSLRRGTSQLKRTPIRRVSKKRAKQLREYTKLRNEFLALHPICQVWLKENGIEETTENVFLLMLRNAPASTEIHHMNRRNGARLNDESEWLAVCRGCHQWIHNNPRAARAAGWLK